MLNKLPGEKKLPKKYLEARIDQAVKKILGISPISFIVRVVDNIGNDGAAEVVGAISYYVILSLFPMLLGIIALLGFFLPSDTIQQALTGFVQQNMPGLEQVLQLNINGIINARGPLGLISIFGLFWSGSAMFSAINRAVNRAWGISHLRHFAIRKLSEVAMSVSATVFLFLSMAGTATLSFFSPGNGLIQKILFSLLSFLLIFVVFLLIYKTVPNTKTYWRFVWPGAALAAIFFEAARTIMSLYFTRVNNFQLVYGSIGSIIVLLVWVYFSAFVMIAGAEVSFEFSRQQLKQPPKRWRLVGVCP